MTIGKEIKVGLLGLGTVGSGVIEIIKNRSEFWEKYFNFIPVVKKVLVKDLNKKRGIEVDNRLLTTDFSEIINDEEIEVIIEVIGGENPAYDYITETLNRKKSVITANKLVMALHGPELLGLALKNGVELGFEASVGGGIPLIEPLKDLLAGNFIEEFLGVINGTTNYILTAMSEKQIGFFDALNRAKALGYAEADPSSDILGWDVCYKLSILTGLSFKKQIPVNKIHLTGIDKVSINDITTANKLGYVVKLLAKGWQNGSEVGGIVSPALVPIKHPLACINGVNNALVVKGNAVGEIIFTGPGAGKMATGSAIVSDLIRICKVIKVNKGNNCYINQVPVFQKEPVPLFAGSFFIALESVTKPDIVFIINHLHDAGIDIQSLFSNDNKDLYYTGIITEECSIGQIQQMMSELAKIKIFQRVCYYLFID